jgi:hypothetical protein
VRGVASSKFGSRVSSMEMSFECLVGIHPFEIIYVLYICAL